MPITLDDIDAILGFGPPARGCAAAPPAAGGSPTPASAPTGNPLGQLAADRAPERARARKRPDDEEGVAPAQCKKKRRMTTEEKVRKFLDGGKWNALLAPGESALSAEFTSRVATAAATMGLPDRVPDAPAHDVLSAAEDGDAAPAPALSKPTYKSIDNLLCLAVAAPTHCNQQNIGRPQRSPQTKATASAGLALTSNASFCRTPEPLSGASTAAAAALPDPSPSVPALSSPARPAAASSMSPAVPIEMGMPKMWRSHSGTQLSCY